MVEKFYRRVVEVKMSAKFIKFKLTIVEVAGIISLALLLLRGLSKEIMDVVHGFLK